jgi:hypothetical protein
MKVASSPGCQFRIASTNQMLPKPDSARPSATVPFLSTLEPSLGVPSRASLSCCSSDTQMSSPTIPFRQAGDGAIGPALPCRVGSKSLPLTLAPTAIVGGQWGFKTREGEPRR